MRCLALLLAAATSAGSHEPRLEIFILPYHSMNCSLNNIEKLYRDPIILLLVKRRPSTWLQLTWDCSCSIDPSIFSAYPHLQTYDFVVVGISNFITLISKFRCFCWEVRTNISPDGIKQEITAFWFCGNSSQKHVHLKEWVDHWSGAPLNKFPDYMWIDLYIYIWGKHKKLCAGSTRSKLK